jgi:flavorubredoxin
MAFGSYGWAPNGPNEVNGYLEEMKVEIIREPLTCKWKPTCEVLDECREVGTALADAALEAEAQGEYCEP